MGEAPANHAGVSPISIAPRCAIFRHMTRIPQFNRGRVEEHGKEAGVFSPDDVERRALEIARIAGRKDVTPDDREQARAELSAARLPAATTEDADSMQSMSRDPSDPPANRGRQTPEYIETDEKQAVERLALEGVEEAQHDQMVGSSDAQRLPSERRNRPSK
jgi:hypothetical protein